jgi:hypothetical protein
MNRDKFIKHELARLNVHLPRKKISLKEALSSPKPRVETRGGGIHVFKREELELLSSLLPEVEWEKLQLPILIAFEPKLGRGTARISGETEAKVVGKILGKAPAAELILYRPEVSLLRGKLPTTTQYLFVP